MKATKSQLLEMSVAYSQCLDKLVKEMAVYREALVKTVRDADLEHEHDFTKLGEQAFLWKLSERTDLHTTVDANMKEVNRLLNLEP